MPLAFLAFYDSLLDAAKGKPVIHLNEVQDLFKQFGMNLEDVREILQFLNQRGLINFFANPASLSSFVIMEPQWLVNAVTTLVRDYDIHGDPPLKTREGKRGWRKYKKTGAIDKQTAFEAWRVQGFEGEIVAEFIETFMIQYFLMTMLVLDNKESFMVPTPNMDLFKGEIDASEMIRASLDFSGGFDADAKNKDVVLFKPIGFYEKVVAAGLDLHASFDGGLAPVLKPGYAQLEFGGSPVIMTLESDLRIGLYFSSSMNPHVLRKSLVIIDGFALLLNKAFFKERLSTALVLNSGKSELEFKALEAAIQANDLEKDIQSNL